jgi:hypothetical protein
VSDLTIADGGAFSLGSTSHNWTGAAPGILRAVTANTGRVLDTMIRVGSYTETEIARLEQFYRAQGGKGLLVPNGVEIVTNGTFAADVSGWTTYQATAAAVAGEAVVTLTATAGGLYQDLTVIPGAVYRILGQRAVGTADNASIRVQDAGSFTNLLISLESTASEMAQAEFFWIPTTATNRIYLRGGGVAGETARFDNVSVRRLMPREEL